MFGLFALKQIPCECVQALIYDLQDRGHIGELEVVAMWYFGVTKDYYREYTAVDIADIHELFKINTREFEFHIADQRYTESGVYEM